MALAAENEVDIFVLDVQMPGMSGFDTAQTLHEQEKYRETPIIFLTGEEDIQQRIKGFDVGGVDYIIKPGRRSRPVKSRRSSNRRAGRRSCCQRLETP